VLRDGYAAALFSNVRYFGDRTPNPDFHPEPGAVGLARRSCSRPQLQVRIGASTRLFSSRTPWAEREQKQASRSRVGVRAQGGVTAR
jgi:hypothetical protein